MTLLARSIFAAAAAATLATSAAAQDFSVGSEAAEWGLFGESKARFEARVVDVVCAVSGDCPADCGGGLRQMALERKLDGALVLVTKNSQPIFTGASFDLAPYCGQSVEVDGLLVGDPEVTPGMPAKVYLVQRIRRAGEDAWAKANGWVRAWETRVPDAPKADTPWYERDPRIAAEIEANGRLGLGAEADKAYAAENF